MRSLGAKQYDFFLGAERCRNVCVYNWTGSCLIGYFVGDDLARISLHHTIQTCTFGIMKCR
jgi:hypothetical protein